MRAYLWLGAAVALAGSYASVASAAPADVENLIRQGVELRRQGKDERALPILQKAYEQAPMPRTAAQLGLVEMQLGYRLDAEQHLGEALASPRDLWIMKNRAALDDSFAKVRAAIGEVTVTGGPVGAEIRLNGSVVGRIPLRWPVRVSEGPTFVEVRSPGYRTASRTVSVVGGGREVVAMTLVADEPPVKQRAAAPEVSRRDLSGAPEQQEKTFRVAGWAMGAAAVAAMGFALFESVTWRGRNAEFERHVGPFRIDPNRNGMNCGGAEPNYGGEGCEHIHEEIAQARILTIVGFGVTAALAAGSFALFRVSNHAPANRSAVGFSCGVSPIGRAGTCRLFF